MESYDPYTDSWTPISPALKYVSNFSAAGCRGRLYLVGSSACKYNALALQCYNPVTGGQPRARYQPPLQGSQSNPSSLGRGWGLEGRWGQEEGRGGHGPLMKGHGPVRDGWEGQQAVQAGSLPRRPASLGPGWKRHVCPAPAPGPEGRLVALCTWTGPHGQ